MGKPVRLAAVVALYFLVGTDTLNGGDVLRMQISPAVSRAPAFVVVRVSVEAADDNRLLEVSAESPDFYRSSQIQIDGAHAAALSVFEFRDLPSGLYKVTSVLVGAHGRRAAISRLAKVEPPFGR